MAHGEKYEDFVEKFKPKKTTDDCYTPENIYNVVAEWVEKEYGARQSSFVRPFWPGGDYESYEYPVNCAVVDNPPFSMLTRIERFYLDRGIKYFLFAPSLTCLSGTVCMERAAIITSSDITYENGAVVRSAFVTNMEADYVLRTATDLAAAIRAENKKNVRKRHLEKYTYPMNVVTSAIVQKYAERGVEYKVRRRDAIHIRQLDVQKRSGKQVFGAGLLLSERAAAERAAAERAAAVESTVWELSERERELIKRLDD